MPALAYASGDTATPLLQETIGQNLESMAARFPDRDALVSMHQGIRQSYRAFDGIGRPAGDGFAPSRPRGW